MQKLVFFLCCIVMSGLLSAKPRLVENPLISLQHIDSMKIASDSMLNGLSEQERIIANKLFIKQLVQLLKTPHSYNYNIDTLFPIKVLTSSDDLFRIITWCVAMDNNTYKYYGAIQMNADSLVLYPLVDRSFLMEAPEQQIGNNENWWGAIYYNIIAKKYRGRSYYTLLGWNGNHGLSNKKVIEILSFDSKRKPVLGASIIQEAGKVYTRKIFEYKEDAFFSITYDPIDNRLWYDHLMSVQPELEGYRPSYVPDGTYEGFQWQKGKWQYLPMMDYLKLEDGQAPLPK